MGHWTRIGERLAVAVAFGAALIGCGAKEPAEGGDRQAADAGEARAKPAKVAPSAAPPASSAPGAGDKSGKSLSNAMPLEAGKPTQVEYPCSGELYLGPFTFTKDPTVLKLRAKTKNPTAIQLCVPGTFVDAAGTQHGGLALGCLDGGVTYESVSSFEYSPGNGGGNVNPVYVRLGWVDGTPEGCKPLPMELTAL